MTTAPSDPSPEAGPRAGRGPRPAGPLALLALALLALHVGTGVPATLLRAKRLLADARPALGKDPLTARRQAFGPAWVDAIEEIRRRIPEDGAYVLVDDQPHEQGAHFWAKHDLAPRRALFLGSWSSLPRPRRLRRQVPGEIQWGVVVTGADQPPRLLTVSELIDEVARHRASLRAARAGKAAPQPPAGPPPR